jgi:hypothetical protein
MTHTHDHHHDTDTDTYYLDQLCLIALSGAFAGVCLTLYFWKTNILSLMLAPQFHAFVLWSGLVLLALVLIRAATLWQAAGRPAVSHAHDHHHEHDHSHHHHHHGHAHCDHDHGEAHSHAAVAEADPPALPQAPGEAHDCGHTHSHAHDCGHDHGWAPWRYVILLLPIMLYLIGLPHRLPGGAASFDLSQEAQAYAAVVAASPAPFAALPLAALAAGEHVDGKAKVVSFKELEGAAYDPVQMQHWRGSVVQVIGQFAPHPASDRAFEVVRFRIQCCGADAIKMGVRCVSRETLPGIRTGDWVRVTGRVVFIEERPEHYVTVLQVLRRNPALPASQQPVVPTDPDPNPYIQ